MIVIAAMHETNTCQLVFRTESETLKVAYTFQLVMKNFHHFRDRIFFQD